MHWVMDSLAHQQGQRNKILERIAKFIGCYKPERILRVAVDGVDGVGKTMFANELGSTVERIGRPVIRSSVDGFHNPREFRYRRGRTSPEGFYLDSYDYAALRTLLLDPLGPGGSGAYCSAAFDHVSDSQLPVQTRMALAGSVLILDGLFLHRHELRETWDFSIFLDAPFDVTVPRGAARGPGWGGSPDPTAPSNRRYVEGQHIYLRENQPQACANVVINYSDLAAPSVIDWRLPRADNASIQSALALFMPRASGRSP
jgi:uridine kinase